MKRARVARLCACRLRSVRHPPVAAWEIVVSGTPAGVESRLVVERLCEIIHPWNEVLKTEAPPTHPVTPSSTTQQPRATERQTGLGMDCGQPVYASSHAGRQIDRYKGRRPLMTQGELATESNNRDFFQEDKSGEEDLQACLQVSPLYTNKIVEPFSRTCIQVESAGARRDGRAGRHRRPIGDERRALESGSSCLLLASLHAC